jgi:TRAP-type uncharacterized transport system substrate-binding protein
MRRYLLALVTAGLAASITGPVLADDPLVFSAGHEGGAYWGAARRFQAVAKGLKLPVETLPSAGSLDNLQQLGDPENPVSLAFSQADALQYYLADHASAGREFEILENIGQECVFILTASDSALSTDADLQKGRKRRLAISSPDSGVAVTFRYMTMLMPELANTEVVYTDTLQAMQALASGDEDAVDAVMVVHRPKEHSPEVDMVLDDLNKYSFVKLRDPRLSQALPGGSAVYEPLDLAMDRGVGKSRFVVKTVCVKGLLVAHKEKITPGQREKLSQLVDYHWIRVFSPEQ